MGDATRIATVARGVTALRMTVGVGALAAPDLTARIFGFPDAHLNDSTRLLARLFGLRELAVGAFTLRGVAADPLDGRNYGLNALVDGGDAVIAVATVVAGRRLTRSLAGTLALAVPIAAAWLKLRAGARAARAAG